jgi:hypothetical protein
MGSSSYALKDLALRGSIHQKHILFLLWTFHNLNTTWVYCTIGLLHIKSLSQGLTIDFEHENMQMENEPKTPPI